MVKQLVYKCQRDVSDGRDRALVLLSILFRCIIYHLKKKYMNKNVRGKQKKREEERRRGKRRKGRGFANLRRCGMNSVNGC